MSRLAEDVDFVQFYVGAFLKLSIVKLFCQLLFSRSRMFFSNTHIIPVLYQTLMRMKDGNIHTGSRKTIIQNRSDTAYKNADFTQFFAIFWKFSSFLSCRIYTKNTFTTNSILLFMF